MGQSAFTIQLAEEGFQPPVLVTREAHCTMDAHAHPLDVKALVIEGELRIRTAAGKRHYGIGEIFQLAAHEPHSEVLGAQGVRYPAGRRPA